MPPGRLPISEIPDIASRPAAIDREDLAVDITAFGCGEEQRGIGDVLRLAGLPERNVGQQLLKSFFEFGIFAVE